MLRGTLIISLPIIYLGASVAFTRVHPSWPGWLVSYAVVLVILMVVCVGLYRDALATQLRTVSISKELLVGIGFVIPMALLVLLWFFAGGPNPRRAGVHGPVPFGAVVFMYTSFAVIEELYFRGVLLDHLAKRWNYPAAVLGSAILFGLVHAGPVGSVSSLIFFTLSGGALGLLTVWRSTVITALAFHVLWNLGGAALGAR